MSKRALIVGFFILLFVLHQDFWWKDDPTLVLGILPISLAYHMGWTLFVALAWFLVGKYFWPHALDEVQPGPAPTDPTPTRDRSPR